VGFVVVGVLVEPTIIDLESDVGHRTEAPLRWKDAYVYQLQ